MTYPISIAAGRIAPQPVKFFVKADYSDLKLVVVDAVKFDSVWASETMDYVGPDGFGSNQHYKYENFKKFVTEILSCCEEGYRYVKASRVDALSDGRVGFTNGRHRYAVMRDAGVKKISVAMDGESIRNAKQHGYLIEGNSEK
jgi:hypothetical protein